MKARLKHEMAFKIFEALHFVGGPNELEVACRTCACCRDQLAPRTLARSDLSRQDRLRKMARPYLHLRSDEYSGLSDMLTYDQTLGTA